MNSTPMLDPFVVKQFERLHRYSFSRTELDYARDNDGQIIVMIDGRTHYLRFPMLKFPHDMLTTDEENRIERGIFDE